MDTLQEFQNWLLRNDRKPITVKRITWDIKNLTTFTGWPISATKVEEYCLLKKSEGLKASYFNDFIDVARIYASFCKEKGYPYDAAIYGIKYFKEAEYVKATLSDDEIEAFLTLPPKQITQSNGSKVFTRVYDPKGYQRWTMFWTICAYSGMRMGEVAKLTVNDVDFGRGVYVVRETKTGDSRIVPIAPNTISAVTEHLAGLEGIYLFPSARGGKKNDIAIVDNVDWHYNFHTRIKRLGIKRTNLTPYSLRHSLITALLAEDVNLFKVQRIVGHKRVETTAHYTHLVTKDIQRAIEQHPLIKKSTDIQSKFTDARNYIEKIFSEELLIRNELIQKLTELSTNAYSDAKGLSEY